MSEPSSSSTLPTQPTSVNYEPTMDITSAFLDTRFDEPETPDAFIPPEMQAASPAQQSPPISSTVQFIEINYIPVFVDTQANTQRLALDPTPWG